MNKNKNNTGCQAGGVAPVGMRDANLQPSAAVMKWATTAGAATPSAAEMRNVAHGGARTTRKHKKAKSHKKHKKSKSHKKAKKTKKTRKHKKGKKSQKRN